MESLREHMTEYKRQLNKGTIQKAYKGLMEYIMALRTRLDNQYPDYFVSSTLYFGYMDMTYFSFTPKSLQRHKLKVAIVFVHESFRFEVWLAAANKQVQIKYWKMLKESGWDKYRLVPTTKGMDSILEHILVEDPDFGDLDALSKQIEGAAVKFIKDVESFLSKNEK